MKVNLSLKSNGVNNAALRIALIYASFSVLWILFSDQILLYFIRNAEIMTKIQMIKGWFFVLITALLIYFLLRKEIYKYKQVEEALRESENNYRTLVECANSVILKWDTKGNIIYLNPYGLKYFNYTEEEIIGKHVVGTIVPDKEDTGRNLKEMIYDITQNPVKYKNNLNQNMRSCGELLWVLWTNEAIFDAGGEFVEILSVGNDATERIKAEEERKSSLSLLNATLDSTADGILVVDEEGKIVMLNKRFVDMWNIPDSIIASQEDNQALAHVLDQLKDPEVFLNKVRKLYAQPDAESYDILKLKDSKVFERYSQPQKIEDKIVGRVWSFRNVTDRYRNEEKIRASEERYRTVLEANPDPMVLYNIEGEVTYVNQAFEKKFGWILDELIGKHLDFVPEENWPETKAAINDMMNGKTINSFETRRLTKEGDVLDIQISASGFKDQDAKYAGSIVTLRDITIQKRAEEVLKESEKKYRVALEANPDPVVVYDMEGKVIYINPAFTRVFGWLLEERIGKKLDDFVPEENWPETQMMIDMVKAGESFYSIETRRLTKQGNVIPVSISASFYRDQEGNIEASVINLRDITDRKKTEEASRKVAALETANVVLENFVSDALGNLLTPIYGHIQLCGIIDNIDEIKSEIEIVEGGIINLLTGINAYREFFRLGERSPEKISSTDISYILDPLLSGQPLKTYGNENFPIDPGVKLRFVYDPKQEGALDWDGLPYVVGDESKIETAIQETLINAVESYDQGKGGDIVVSAKKENYDLILEVADKGRGMSKEERDKSQLPFFKVLGVKGSGRFGLGAYIACESAKYCGGDIHIESTEGVGTTASILLKISD